MSNEDRNTARNDASGQAGWLNNTLLSSASRLAHVGGWAIELPEYRVLWSEEMHILMDFPPHRPPSLSEVLALYPPPARKKLTAALAACARDGTPFDLELQFCTGKGRLLDVRVIGHAVRNEMGLISCIEGAFQDITEEKQTAKELLHGKQRFRQLADAMPQIVWTGDPDGTIDYLSRGTDNYTGISMEEDPAARWLQAVHPEDRPLALQAWQEAYRGGSIFQVEYRIIHAADNTYRWHLIRGVPIRDDAGNIIKWYGTATDIHDRKLYEQQVRSLAQRLTTTLESITDGFFLLDRDWRFTYLNREAERVLQRERGELLGKSIWEELGQQEAFHEHCHHAIQDRCTVVFEEYYAPLSVWLEVRAYPSEEGLAVYFRDVTSQKNAALELQRANRALQMISRCSEALIRAEKEQELLQQICRLAVDIGGYRMAWVGYMQENEARSIMPAAHVGASDDILYIDQLKVSWGEQQPGGKGPAGRSMRSGRPEICEDIEQDPALVQSRESARRHGLRGIIALPLLERGRAFGVLVLYTRDVYRPAAEEVRLLQELANDLAFGIINLRAHEQQERLQDAVLKVAAGVSASTGTAFFEQLVCRMAEALGAQAGGVARLLPGEPPVARTLALVIDGRILENLDYPLQGTASENFMQHADVIASDERMPLFPHPPVLADIGARAYAARRLDNSAGQPIGLLFVLYREPLRHSEFIRSTLNIFAARAASELERLDADAKIRNQASLLDKAQDAIIVRSMDDRVLYWNKGAERLYGWSSDEAVGRQKRDLVSHDLQEFDWAIREVMRHGDWQGEMTQRHKNGSCLTVEAHWTLVRDDEGAPQAILSINTDITQRKATEQKLQLLAFYDPLTRLPNRQLLQDRVEHALAVSTSTGHHCALMLLDLDHFKNLNDTAGHETGDLLLQQVAERLRPCITESDTLARFGGDEYVILLETPLKDMLAAMDVARKVGDRILRAFHQPFQLGDHEYHSTPSIGVTMFCGNSHGVDELLKRAELAMYQAKAAGRNGIRFFDPAMQATVSARAALERDFRNGLRRDEFMLVYQPQIDSGGHVAGTEALVRWQPQDRAAVSPAQFIPLAEDTGLILSLGQWVLETACRQLAEWRQRPQTAGLTVAVNVSARQFHHPDFVSQVMNVLEQTGADPRYLKLELTESLLVDDIEDAIIKMDKLKERGLSFSLDDFGTGYSSLAYLKRLPLDQLKIDQSFVRDVLTDPNDAAIARTIVALGQTLGLAVIAEGVEVEAQRDFLAGNGCHAYQGYLFSRPLPASQFEAYLEQRQAASRLH